MGIITKMFLYEMIETMRYYLQMSMFIAIINSTPEDNHKEEKTLMHITIFCEKEEKSDLKKSSHQI